MAVEAKLCSPIRSTFEALVVQRAVGHCPGELATSDDKLLSEIKKYTDELKEEVKEKNNHLKEVGYKEY